MRRRDFERLVSDALEELPRSFQLRLENVAVVTQRWPSPRQLRQAGVPPGETLFGLYEGVPLTERDGYNMALPDKITLFQGPIEAECRTRREMSNEVRETVAHEVAHYFGISDEELDQWGVG